MQKTYVSVLAGLSLLLVLSAASATPLAPDYRKVGVKIGDAAIYESSFTAESWDETHISVYGIVGSVVTFNVTWYEPSGAVGASGLLAGDIYIGGNSIFNFLIAADLATSDPIWSEADEAINDTILVVVGGVLRTVNHLRYYGGEFEGYWDAATGLMIELRLFSRNRWVNYTLLSTTAWSPLSLWNMTTVALIEGVVIVVLAIALIVVVVKRWRH